MLALTYAVPYRHPFTLHLIMDMPLSQGSANLAFLEANIKHSKVLKISSLLFHIIKNLPFTR